LQKNKRRGSLSKSRGIPERNKECGSHLENSTTGTNVYREKLNKNGALP
jgi:hypothetical protein